MLAASAALALALLAGAAGAPAQQNPPLSFDPSVANQGTSLFVTADESILAPGGQRGGSITVALPRGMRFDTAARQELCRNRDAARATCPPTSRIGFGRFGLDVRGYELAGGGETELGWQVDAFLGEAQERGDAASVVLVAKLLGTDLVTALLAPSLKTTIPATTTTIGRVVRRSGDYGIELRFPSLPVQLDVAAPASAMPARFELSLSAVRRVRQNFIRRFRIKTPSGSEVRKVRDHRLVPRFLLRTPATCRGSWPSEVRVALPDDEVRVTRRIACS